MTKILDSILTLIKWSLDYKHEAPWQAHLSQGYWTQVTVKACYPFVKYRYKHINYTKKCHWADTLLRHLNYGSEIILQESNW